MNTNQEKCVSITKEIIRRTTANSTLLWKLAEMKYCSVKSEISSVEEELQRNREELKRLYADLDASDVTGGD